MTDSNTKDITMPRTRVKWLEGKTFVGTGANGHSIVIGSGEQPAGVSPMQLLLLGLGGCASIDVVDISAKQRQPLDALEVFIDGERGEGTPSPWGKIHMHFIAAGQGLNNEKLERAIALGLEKYCGAYATLAGVASITWDYEVTDGDADSDGESSEASSDLIRAADAPIMA
jgi:putative redox protein